MREFFKTGHSLRKNAKVSLSLKIIIASKNDKVNRILAKSDNILERALGKTPIKRTGIWAL
jgi:hypothetical protein